MYKVQGMTSQTKTGTVYLVGAGPGDLGLVTMRARELIESADVLVYDYLANPKLLDWTREECEKVYVGKQSGRHSIPQDEIETILIDRARKGLSVVRLKGGDPFVFGRGGEEVEQLEQDRISFEIVPGVTAALAAAAYVGIPLTHRDYSSSIMFLTGHENPEKHTLSIDFHAHGNAEGTLCIYMGIGQLPRIIEELKAGGMPGDKPVAIVEWATLNSQRSLFSIVDSIVADLEASDLGAPAVIIIGEVVARRSETKWFEDRPLMGKRIVVTRAREQAGKLSKLLEREGAEVLELPFIKVERDFDRQQLGEILAGIATYDWILFTSTNGVRFFFELFYKAFDDIRCLGPMRIAAVGAATAREIEKHRLKVDLVPERANGNALADALIKNESIDNIQMLVITGNQNRETLVQRLETEGKAIVDTLPLYKTTQADLGEHPAAARFRREGADAVLFTSSSTVRSFVDQSEALELEPSATKPVLGSIGPLTTSTLEEYKLPVGFEAEKANLIRFVQATIQSLDE